MAAEQHDDVAHSLTVPSDQPLLGVLVEEDGHAVVRYFAGDVPAQGEPDDEVIADALRLAGAWSDLDWERTADELDRIRHATPPTPPLDLDL
jgi:hypothetical protein